MSNQKNQNIQLSPQKIKSTSNNLELESPLKYDRYNTKVSKQYQIKNSIPSFLEGFQTLTEDDMEILAEFEEEQSRKGHF